MENALAAVRFVHFLSAMGVFGMALFAWAFAPEALARALSPAMRQAATGLSVLALVSAVAWLALEAGEMGGEWGLALDPRTLSDVLTLTAFGDVWQARLVLALALAGAALFTPASRWPLLAVLSGALVASLGLVGHAAMQTGGVGFLHRVNHALHLLAAAAWLGGLIPFVMCLRAFENAASRSDATIAMARFSAAGHFNVLLILATGAANIALTTGAAPWPPSSPYRTLLLSKLALVAIMVATALYNRYALVPRIEPGAPSLRVLKWTSIGETALAAVVVALVSLFGLLDPA